MMAVAPKDALSTLPSGLRDDLLSAFNAIIKNYREHRWEPSELNGGKLCEAAFTIVEGHLKGSFPARAKKPGRFPEACLGLEQKYAHVPCSRSPRILIPRMMLGLYDIRNNRGVGHAGGDVDPNHMDATAVLNISKWLVAELVRILHSLPTSEATAVVESLVEREVAHIWSDGDLKRVLKPTMSYREQTLALLLSSAGEVSDADLVRWVEHPSQTDYRRKVLRPLHRARMVEYDEDSGVARLLPPGVEAAEALVAAS